MNTTVKINKIDFRNQLIIELDNMISQKFSYLFQAVIAHGSVATNEVIAYSDFDGMLIVKDAFWDTQILKNFHKETMKIIHRFDPLQHHGWFQIKASDLNDYSEVKNLPLAVIKEARMIFPPKDTEFTFCLCENEDYNAPALRVINSIYSKLESGTYRESMFNLKSFLSEVMLLPSLVYQAQNSRGIFKKESFDAMRSSYSSKSWQAIIASSRIREKWTYNFVVPVQLFLRFKNNRYLKKLVRKYWAPKITPSIAIEINASFVDSIKNFLDESKEIIKGKNIQSKNAYER